MQLKGFSKDQKNNGWKQKKKILSYLIWFFKIRQIAFNFQFDSMGIFETIQNLNFIVQIIINIIILPS